MPKISQKLEKTFRTNIEVRAAEDCQAEVETLSTQKAALRKEVDKMREQRQVDLRSFTMEVDEQKKLTEQLRQELASTQDAYRELLCLF